VLCSRVSAAVLEQGGRWRLLSMAGSEGLLQSVERLFLGGQELEFVSRKTQEMPRCSILFAGFLAGASFCRWLLLSRRNRFRRALRGELPAMAFISAIDKMQSRSMVKDRQVKSKSLSERLSRS